VNAKDHAIKVAAAKVLTEIVTEGYERVRADAEQVFGAARRELSVKTLDPELDGVSLGTVSILVGPTTRTVDHGTVAAVAAATHGTVEVFRPGALEDENLLEFVRDQLPHLLETKVRDEDLKATYKAIDKSGHLQRPDGTKVKVVEEERGEPTGEFRFRASKDARPAVLAAWHRGELQELFVEMVRPAIEAGELGE
jgi:hypothetical protein